MKRYFVLTLSITLLCVVVADNFPAQSQSNVKPKEKGSASITFIELGSVNCIPCRLMQPVMKSIGKKYGNQINVVFYDIWTREQSKYAQVYGIRVIPTQVFLDKEGKEVFRHEGFFPEAEIDKLVQKHGLTARTK
ncbi:MAG: thioredoxin fold domain-containing protein [Bacteroidota bacterium]